MVYILSLTILIAKISPNRQLSVVSRGMNLHVILSLMSMFVSSSKEIIFTLSICSFFEHEKENMTNNESIKYFIIIKVKVVDG